MARGQEVRMTNDDLETVLRASFAARAAQAPSGELLAERIIADADLRPAHDFHAPRGPRWRTWTLPLIAAGSVAAIAAVLVGVSNLHHSAAPLPPADTHLVSPSPSPSHASAPVVPPATATAPNPAGIHGFHVLDMTFDALNDGYALGSSHCLSGPGTCTALVHTTDGTHWTAISGTHSTPFNVEGDPTCATACVSHIRFATQRTGYVFGPSALFMTTDGGVSWTPEAGGADALETLDNNVIRIKGIDVACVGACAVVQTAPIGSTTWTTQPGLAGWPVNAVAVDLSRQRGKAYLLAQTYNPAKGNGGGDGGSLYVSSTGGATWTLSKSGCPYIGDGYFNDMVGLATASDGSATLACTSGGTPVPNFYAGGSVTSTDGGVTFVRQPQGGKLGPISAIGAADATTIFAVASDKACLCSDGRNVLYRSTDGGNSWTPVPAVPVAGTLPFFGFEDAAVGRIVTDNATASTVWTTHDAGLTWSSVTFG
jgi:photosystem II stability/assembly factor-like uncharacterized protein